MYVTVYIWIICFITNILVLYDTTLAIHCLKFWMEISFTKNTSLQCDITERLETDGCSLRSAKASRSLPAESDLSVQCDCDCCLKPHKDCNKYYECKVGRATPPKTSSVGAINSLMNKENMFSFIILEWQRITELIFKKKKMYTFLLYLKLLWLDGRIQQMQ